MTRLRLATRLKYWPRKTKNEGSDSLIASSPPSNKQNKTVHPPQPLHQPVHLSYASNSSLCNPSEDRQYSRTSKRQRLNHIQVKVEETEEIDEPTNDSSVKRELHQSLNELHEPYHTLDEATNSIKSESTNQSSIKREPSNSTSVKSEPTISTSVKYEPTLEPTSHDIGSTRQKSSPNHFQHVDPNDYALTPPYWHKIYDRVVDMRAKFMAPVDTQGCERIAETITPNIRTTNPRIYRFQLLISLMLSLQTKDEVNFDAMKKLRDGLLAKGHPMGLTLESMLTLSTTEIDAFIAKVGFHNRKAVYIYQACRLLEEKFDGDVPKTIDGLVSLPGVGPKMGYLLLQCAWGINEGIGVDVHLHRLAQMWGWTKKAKNPEQTRLELQDWLPRKYWTDVNPLLVGFGQVICVPRAPNCDICSLARDKLCKGVNRKLLTPEMSDARKEKLRKQRADLLMFLD